MDTARDVRSVPAWQHNHNERIRRLEEENAILRDALTYERDRRERIESAMRMVSAAFELAAQEPTA